MYDFKRHRNLKLKWCNAFCCLSESTSFVNFYFGGYLLQNGIAGLIIEAETIKI